MSAIKISIDIKRKKFTASLQATPSFHPVFNFAFASHRKCRNNICRNKLCLCLKWMRCGHNLVVLGSFCALSALSLSLSLSLAFSLFNLFFILQWTHCSVFSIFFQITNNSKRAKIEQNSLPCSCPKMKILKTRKIKVGANPALRPPLPPPQISHLK